MRPPGARPFLPQTVLDVAEKCEPGWTCGIRFRPTMNAQNTPNNILVDLDAGSQRNLWARWRDGGFRGRSLLAQSGDGPPNPGNGRPAIIEFLRRNGARQDFGIFPLLLDSRRG
jgi:hypothetical protein